MTYFRKPSASGLLYSALPANFSESGRLRLLFTKRGIVYTGTALFLLVSLSLLLMGVPDARDMSSRWTSNQDFKPGTTSILPLDDVVLPPIQHDDSGTQTSTTSSDTTSTTIVAELPPATHHLADEKHTEDGFPLISTRNNGKLVLLTGATGPGNFFEIPNFYPIIMQNRLDYANHHGNLLPYTPPYRQRKLTAMRVRFNDGGFSLVRDYTNHSSCVGQVTCYPRSISTVSTRRMGVVVRRRCHCNDS